MNKDKSSAFKNKVNVKAIGLWGHSVAFVSGDPMTAKLIPEIDAISLQNGGGNAFFPIVGIDLNVLGELVDPPVNAAISKLPLLFNNTRQDFSILGLENAFAFLWGAPTPAEPYRSLTNPTIGFVSTAEGPTFYTLLENADHSSYTEYTNGLINWPDLQNDIFGKQLEAGTYTHISGELSHQINADTNIAFFDCYLKHDRTGLSRLLNIGNKYSSEGLDLVIAKNYDNCRGHGKD